MKRLVPAALVLLSLASTARADPATTAKIVAGVRAHHQAHAEAILTELADFLALPSLASDEPGIRKNAEHLRRMLERRGFRTDLLTVPGSPPAVFGELPSPGARHTVVFYAHYDGQPVRESEWASPPYTPTLRDAALEDGGKVVPFPGTKPPYGPEWRLYARAASDDKGPIVAVMAALDALRAQGLAPSVNLKIFLEGEEEAGSPHLGDILRSHAERLRADAWIFADGPVHPSRKPQIVFGARGVMGLELKVYGPVRPLHSGHYGNWAPNPALMLAELLTQMRSAAGENRIPGLLDTVRPITEADRAAIAALPVPDAALRQELGLAATEAGNALLAERVMLPSFNVQGLASAGVGSASNNAIPSDATAAIDIRMVPDQKPEEVRKVVEAHLRALGWHLVDQDPDLATRRAHPKIVRVTWWPGYRAVRTSLELPVSRATVQVASEAYGEPVMAVPILGGSLPLYHFEDVLQKPLVLVPMVNHDNRQHAPNENLRLQNLWEGIELYAALIARLGPTWEALEGR
jgi:acetylornithine deacetylase/succinyl-diaminopimelate desuccinylase-like protein